MAKPIFKPALPLSYASRSGNAVRVQLQLDDPSRLTADSTYLRLRSTGQPGSSTVVPLKISTESKVGLAEVPSGGLFNSSWRIEVSNGPNGPFSAVPAFLLISDPNPIALLLGRPEEMDRLVATPVLLPSKRRLAHRVGTVVDRAVAELPPSAARRSRARIRKVARRLLR